MPGNSTGVASQAATSQPAKIVYVNVGQGDAVVMRIGGKIIVSDAGEHRILILMPVALRKGAASQGYLRRRDTAKRAANPGIGRPTSRLYRRKAPRVNRG